MPSMRDALWSALVAAGQDLPASGPIDNPPGVDAARPGQIRNEDDAESVQASRTDPELKRGRKAVLARTSSGEVRVVPVTYGPSQPRNPKHRHKGPNNKVAKPAPASVRVPDKVHVGARREVLGSALSHTVAPPPTVTTSLPVSARVAEVFPNARCLVEHYPDTPRAAANHGGTLDPIVQLAPSAAVDVHDVTIGLDFGTSTVKVVVTDASLEQSLAVPLCATDTFDAYLLPSRVYERGVEPNLASDERAYSLVGGTVVHRDLKLGLLGHPDSLAHRERVVAFFALVLRSVRAWLFKRNASVYRRARIAWRVAIGLPSTTVLNNVMAPLLQRMVCAAWHVAGQRGAVTSGRVRRALHDNLTPEALDLEVNVLPEIAAQIYGFVVSQRFDRKAANRFVMVDVGAGTIDSALFRVLPPKRGMWSFEFFTAVVQPLGVANLHAHRVNWWERMLAGNPQAAGLLEQLSATKFATDMELAPPVTYRDYFKGVSVDKMPSPSSPDEEFFQQQVMNQVRGQTMWRAWKESLLPKEALTGVPIFVCGGGSRMRFYERINDEIGRMPGCTWLSAEPWLLGFPEDLFCESSDQAYFDRLSVAYGLSRLNLDSVIQAPPMPSIEVAQQAWSDRYIDKDAC